MMYKPEVEKHIIPENSLLRNVVFDEEFEGEHLVTEGGRCDLKEKCNTRFVCKNMRLGLNPS